MFSGAWARKATRFMMVRLGLGRARHGLRRICSVQVAPASTQWCHPEACQTIVKRTLLRAEASENIVKPVVFVQWRKETTRFAMFSSAWARKAMRFTMVWLGSECARHGLRCICALRVAPAGTWREPPGGYFSTCIRSVWKCASCSQSAPTFIVIWLSEMLSVSVFPLCIFGYVLKDSTSDKFYTCGTIYLSNVISFAFVFHFQLFYFAFCCFLIYSCLFFVWNFEFCCFCSSLGDQMQKRKSVARQKIILLMLQFRGLAFCFGSGLTV